MFAKLNYQDVCTLIHFLEDMEDLSLEENKALDKLRAIKSLQELKYNKTSKQVKG